MEEKKPVKKDQEIVYYQEDEIDLYELWLILKKRWKVVVSTTLIFVITAIVYIFIAKPVYTSSFFVKIPKNISGYIKYNEKGVLRISPVYLFSQEETISLIKRFNYKSKDFSFIIASESKEKENKETIKIEIGVYKPSIIPDISKSLISYLNSNPYVKRKIETERAKLQIFIKESKDKLHEMEKTKELIYKDLKNGKIQNLGFNPLDLDTKILNIKKEIAELEIRLKNLKGFEISVYPAIPEKPSKPKKKLILAVSVVSGLFLGVFLAFFFEWIENASRRHKEKQL